MTKSRLSWTNYLQFVSLLGFNRRMSWRATGSGETLLNHLSGTAGTLITGGVMHPADIAALAEPCTSFHVAKVTHDQIFPDESVMATGLVLRFPIRKYPPIQQHGTLK